MTETSQVEPRVQEAIVKESKKRTIYDASSGEIMGKNFLAGMSHAAGSILVYLIFASGVLFFLFRFVYPVFAPYVDIYKQSMESLQMMNSFFPGQSSSMTIEPAATGVNPDGEISPTEQEAVEQQLEQRYTPQQLDQARQVLEQMQNSN